MVSAYLRLSLAKDNRALSCVSVDGGGWSIQAYVPASIADKIAYRWENLRPLNAPLSPERIERFKANVAEFNRRTNREKQSKRGGLIEFVRYFWKVLEPQTPMVDGWAMEAICQHLEAVTFGEITRLLITVPPGFCKPIHVDELVYTDRGFVRLGDIVVGDNVLTHKGRFKPVKAVHEQGIIPTVTLSTFNGRSVRAAPDHPFLTPRGWVPVGQLTNQDYVGIPRLQETIKTELVTSEEARLLGYLVGDGCISHRSLAFVNADEDVINDFIFCAKSIGFHAYRANNGHPVKTVKASKIVLKSTEGRWSDGSEPPVLQWLTKHGLYKSNSYTKRIPEAVLGSSSDIVENFIGAYWSCDGTIGVRHSGKKTTMISSATTVGLKLAEDVQRALFILNIEGRVRRRDMPKESIKQPGGIYTSYNIIVCNRNEVAKFCGMKGLCPRKSNIAKQAFFDHFEPNVYADAVMSVETAPAGECRCLTVADDCSFTVNGIAVHNSLLTSVFWPLWEWSAMGMPHTRYVCFSYSASLTERDNTRFRDIAMSPEFKHLWGDVFDLVKVGETQVSNTKTGWKLASSVGGVGTGQRAGRVILDDPHSIKQAESELIRTETTRWFREAMSNRLNDMANDAIIVIMQRSYDSDVAGVILDGDFGYCVLSIEMELDTSRETFGTPNEIGWIDPRTIDEDGNRLPAESCEGILAWPEKFPRSVCEQTKTVVGPWGWAAQYMQNPTPRGGGIYSEAGGVSGMARKHRNTVLNGMTRRAL